MKKNLLVVMFALIAPAVALAQIASSGTIGNTVTISSGYFKDFQTGQMVGNSFVSFTGNGGLFWLYCSEGFLRFFPNCESCNVNTGGNFREGPLEGEPYNHGIEVFRGNTATSEFQNSLPRAFLTALGQEYRFGFSADHDPIGGEWVFNYMLFPPDHPILGGYVVNSSGDEGDADLNDSECDVDLETPGCQCTLRAAIQQSSIGFPALLHIIFDIPTRDGETPTIRPQSPLPKITHEDLGTTRVIDGTTQPRTGKIELDGSNAGDSDGLVIEAGNTHVRGLVINRFQGNGIVLAVHGNNVVEGNFIGTDFSGTDERGNGKHGVLIQSSNNTIGGTNQGTLNIISGNSLDGVNIFGINAVSNLIQCNYIGTSRFGSIDLGNAGSGVAIVEAPNNIVGTPDAELAFSNLISGNGSDGIRISGETASGNKVQWNFIGLDATGTFDLGNDGNGVSIVDAPNNTIGGASEPNIRRGNIISFNNGNGIAITGDRATRNKVQSNYIGTNPTGTFASGNDGDGLRIEDSSNNLIGGLLASTGNLISGNRANGVTILGTLATGNKAQGNFIGTTSDGTQARGNSGAGVSIEAGASDNRIGGILFDEGNLISGNTEDGVRIVDSNTQQNKVQSNFIGTDKTGISLGNGREMGNGWDGIFISGGASNNLIGEFPSSPTGASTPPGNLISGNKGNGIRILGSDSNSVRGNIIGSDKLGDIKLGNSEDGVFVGDFAFLNFIDYNTISGNFRNGIRISGFAAGANQVERNRIGIDHSGNGALSNDNDGIRIENGATANKVGFNLVSGNGLHGIRISDSSGNRVYYNDIGTDLSGAGPLPNRRTGVFVEESASDNQIDHNRILYNGEDGVVVESGFPFATGNAIRANSIFSNSRLGIDLNADGVTFNDLGDGDTGGNDRQNFPELVSVTLSGSRTIIRGRLNSKPNTTYTLDFFVNAICDLDFGFGQGRRYIDSTNVITSGVGDVNFDFAFENPIPEWRVFTATATDPNNNTSEFSQCALLVFPPPACSTVVTNSNDSGLGSFRAAIECANASPGFDTIIFNLPGTGPHTITAASALPTITDPVIIDGTSQPGFAGAPIIELNGSAAGPVVAGLSFVAGNSTVRGLMINRFNGHGIALELTGGNVIEGNFIGTDGSGSAGMGNAGDGIFIDSGAGNKIGGSELTGNVISFNGGDGVHVSSGTNQAILFNSIFSNAGLGIDLGSDGVTPNDLGDDDSGPNNLQNSPLLTAVTISSNAVALQGTLNSRTNTTFALQFFASPTCDASGFGEGQTFIGSTTMTTDGIGNQSFNISLPISVPSGQLITATATDPNGNTSEFSQCIGATNGLTIACPIGMTLGADLGQCSAVVNYPPPTVSDPAAVVSCLPPSGSTFPIGTNTVVCTATNASGNTATCSFTVTVSDTENPTITCPGDIIRPADLGQCAAVVTYNPPALDNCPEVTVVCVPPSGSTFPIGTGTVTCTATDAAGNRTVCTFTVTVNDTQAPSIACPPDQFVPATSPNGAVVNYPPPTGGDNCPGLTVVCNPPSGSTFPIGTTSVTCTAEDAAGNQTTCAFTVTVTGGCSTVVSNTNDGGPGSLRAAIECANAQPGSDNITFSIPGPGPFSIHLLAELSAITDPVIIDGTTQSGFAGTPIIELDGSSAGPMASGLTIRAGTSVVRGLVINRFDGPGVVMDSADQCEIAGNFIGTDLSGTVGLGNGLGTTSALLGGVLLFDSDHCIIGGLTPAARNIISANDLVGLFLDNGSDFNFVQGNFIGVDVTGTLALGAHRRFVPDGVSIRNSSHNIIGGTTVEARNVISGNHTGIAVQETGSTGNLVQGNFIGTGVDGTSAVGNIQEGVALADGHDNTIGGTTKATGNVIAFNRNDGVSVESGTSNAILGNSIFANAGVGINLGHDGVTPNDPGDGDTGANNLQNFPTLTLVASGGGSSAGNTTIRGSLNSVPGTSFRIEFFANDKCDPSGFGEGQRLIGAWTVTTGASGNENFRITFSGTLHAGQFVGSPGTELEFAL